MPLGGIVIVVIVPLCPLGRGKMALGLPTYLKVEPRNSEIWITTSFVDHNRKGLQHGQLERGGSLEEAVK